MKTVLRYAALFACMAIINFALPQRELLAFPLFYAALVCGFNPFLCTAGYLLSSAVALDFSATLCCGVQACFLTLVFVLYKRFSRKMKFERVLYALLCQLPFIFLYPHTGYALFSFPVIWQKVIIGAFLFLFSMLAEGGLHALLFRAFRCKLSAGELAELTLVWLFLGTGIINAFTVITFFFLSLCLVLLAAVLLKNASAVPFAIVLSLPLAFVRVSAVPLAEYAVLGSAALLFVSYGAPVSALAFTAAFLGINYLEGLYTRGVAEIVLTVLACVLPAIAVCCIPEKLYRKAKNTLLFYRERTLPRIAINRNRRAVGEQLYEVSALFREIENSFREQDLPDHSSRQLRDKLEESLCKTCPSYKKCEKAHVRESLDKLIAIGKAKGRVNLIDMPGELASLCSNSAGMLFALNKLLAEHRRYLAELESAREGRRLLAQQAHGVSEILREIALEQSEEYVFSDEETVLSSALSSAGILTSEIFLYGEGSSFTVSLTIPADTNGKKLCEIAGNALRVPLSLSEIIPLTRERSCFVLKRKANFDAAFGIASRSKEGEMASGDTHSILKIDERRFLVALSDGMGSGEEARDVSDQTLSLLESFYKAKMPSETVLSTVNRLIAYSAEETFSCLDLAAVNLDTGGADIVKIGSPVGFLLSGDELKILEGESLPIGMLEAVHPATLRVNMKEGDFLIFMSDGVTSAFGSSADLCAYISELHPLNPQSLAEEILGNALGRYGGKAEDDMTVLAVKLTEAA
ncbi:MAG: SpoIIE family protein phosphatase [Clostridia bacterium]|nr:SpoIIE family protein phosphatase [Clostridia bacterium]